VPTLINLVATEEARATRRESGVAVRGRKAWCCTRVYTQTPKKPNSALRKVARVRLTNE